MKKFYIKGNILINTPLFYCKNAGAYCDYQDDMELLETNSNDERYGPYLLIDEEHPQSMFAEYYAQGGLSTYCGASPIFENTYQKNVDFFTSNVDKALKIHSCCQSKQNIGNELNYQVYIMIVSALDTYIVDTLLTTILNNQNAFNQYVVSNLITSSKKADLMKCYVNKGEGSFEQEVLKYALEQSYSRKETIEKVFSLPMIDIKNQIRNELQPMDAHFNHRHLIVHRIGRQKDGNQILITDDELSSLISDCRRLVFKIHSLLVNFE